MATVAEFTLPAEEFPLGTVFSELSDVTIQLERVIPDANGVVPYFWVQGTESDAIVEQFSENPGVRDIREVDHVEDEFLMRCEWVTGHDSVLDALIAPEIVLLSATGTAEQWTFDLRGESRESISEFREYCHDHGVSVTLTELHALRRLIRRMASRRGNVRHCCWRTNAGTSTLHNHLKRVVACCRAVTGSPRQPCDN